MSSLMIALPEYAPFLSYLESAAGLGEPFFDSLESTLSHLLFSVPAVKGIEFGLGFGFSDVYGSEANDPITYDKGFHTATNNNGGINGGISNGMPIRIRTVIKPTASIYKEQNTVDLKTHEAVKLQIQGRHDPRIKSTFFFNPAGMLIPLNVLHTMINMNRSWKSV